MADALSASIFIGETVSGGTSGSILYIDANGKAAQNNASLFWDNTNSFLKVGTTDAVNGKKYLRFPNLDPGQTTQWGFTQGYFINATGPRNDVMLFYGYNFNTVGGQEVAGEPCIGFQLESYVDNGQGGSGIFEMEAHLSFIRTGGQLRRPWSYRIGRVAGDIHGTYLGDQQGWLASDSSANLQFGIGTQPNSNALFHLKGSTIQLWEGTGYSANGKYYDLFLGADTILQYRVVNDAYSTATVWLEMNRSGTSVTNVKFPNGLIGINVTPSGGNKLHVVGPQTTFGSETAAYLTEFANALIWTHNNTAYRGSLGTFSNGGHPFLGLHAEHGTTADQARNDGAGFKGFILYHDQGSPSNVVFRWNQSAVANAGFAATTDAFKISSAGDVTVGVSGATLSFFGAALVAQQTQHANTAYSDSGATVVHSAGTFTGGVGATAYTIGDIVAALKNYGLLVA